MNDIPIEGVVKHLKLERDRYKAKLHEAITIAKEREAGLLDEITKLQYELVSQSQKYDRLKNRQEKLNAEYCKLKKDYRKSKWYNELCENNRRLKLNFEQVSFLYNRALLKTQD